MRPETIAIHSGFQDDPATKAVAVPIYQTASYAFDSAAHGAALFDLEEEGYRYSRISNPTLAVLEKRIADLEGGTSALAVASGQAASYYAFLTAADAGGNIVSVPQLYGATHTLLANILPRQGIEGRFARSDRASDIAQLIDENTRAVFCESIGNPAGNICDIEAIATAAHAAGVPLIVDNTVATPILLKPIDYGADVVVHSLTKYLGGHGTTLGGVIVDAGTFPWARHASRFPLFNEPDQSYHGLVYAERYEHEAFVARCRSVYQRTTGAVLSPFNAFLLLQGIETVALRIERHVENGRRVADFLRADARIEWVSYAGFEESPYYALAQKYLAGRPPALLTFGVRGGYDCGTAFYDRLKLIKRLVNIGDAKSLACHPASTTHRQMSPAEQARAGVTPETIRLSVGIEHIDDILEDLDQALAARRPRPRERVNPQPAAKEPTRRAPTPAADRPSRSFSAKPALTIALVNNMPDAALLATERQFSALLAEAAGDSCEVKLALYALPGIPRGDLARATLRERYAWTDRLEKLGADAVIVTGCEPRAQHLVDEPYWRDFTRLVDWARTNTRSAIFSCLAAHAAVLHLDGIERRRANSKVSGVFAFERVADSPLTSGIADPVFNPHSRHYGLPAEDLANNGYQILTRSAQVGVDMFLRDGPSVFLFLQGHPEYDPDSLMREYRRDLGRFLRGEQAASPPCPQTYFDPKIEHAFHVLSLAARRGRVTEVLKSYDEITDGFMPAAAWRTQAVGLYRNWLELVAEATERAPQRQSSPDPAELRMEHLPGAAE
ncbi:homoserine O-succinyltransferase [Phenylobacterium sp. LjRoot225]|uniref:homoserine O-succinyltransferase MetA n=1 Tax=Phenylobacterium sp. LjRoot225 TaxID=3342285 RepID=UPI003ECD2B58